LVAVLVAVVPPVEFRPVTDEGLLSPQGLAHAVGGVLGKFRGDVRVALGLAELGVAENLLDDADADALL
jgi:hypothetical protein